ncbi:FadR/GntR family transcriptional regulator [Arthrobacter castelli]|uniref:FadR/GntR family transcriptional regulator n=1 Tax=Arthrobacter castelli TaxID=271431 RepID=UPI000406C1F1|nr:FadR/GntR family transcriptional regulator [Arthrobacter castelli]
MPSRLHQKALESLGTRIVDGVLPAGHIMLAEDLESELGVSRSVVREAVRVLQSAGLVQSTKRVGIKVLPRPTWNPYDPLVIRWRLRSSGRGAQLRSLTEMRVAVEPMAAELAADHAPEWVGEQLHDIANKMRATGQDARRFQQLDVRFHAVVLAGSGNEMFAGLHDAVAEVLTGRQEMGLIPAHPHEEAIELHLDVAEAIALRRPAEARETMNEIMRATIDEIHQEWAGTPRSDAGF